MSQPRINGATDPRNANYSHNLNSFNVINFSGTDERLEILDWLSPLEPRIRHQDIRTRRADSVGEWVLQTDEFQKWCDDAHEGSSEPPTLLCCGDPAVGKTYFSSLVVDRLCDKADEQNIAVSCFYVDFAAREEQSPTNVLGSLLKQIVGGLERIPGEISRAFQNYKKVIGGRGLRVPEIAKMLQTVTSLRRAFICLDGLDECAEGDRPEVLHSLRQILEQSPGTRIFLTGRRHIRGEVETYLGGRVAVISIKPNNDDVVGYIRTRLRRDTCIDAMDSGLEAEIIRSIAEKIPETFLLISLTIDAILGETTVYGRWKKLRAMTNGLDLKGVYGTTLERIKAQGGERAELGVAALMWISHSERPLQLGEIRHALAVEIGSTGLNLARIPSVETLLSSCLGLIVADKEASTIRLIHFTLQEYLYTCPDFFGAAHSIMAEICLTYLNFRPAKEIPPSFIALHESNPFLRYCSLSWGAHASRGATRDVVSLALKLFSQIESHISTRLLLLDTVSRTGRYHRDIPIDGGLVGFTGLHLASIFGIVEIATTLMDLPGYDLNGRDFLGITPLIWAAICGQERVAGLLLERQAVIPDKPDGYFRRTALSWAAGKGSEGIVKILLGRASSKHRGTDKWWDKAPRAIGTALRKRYVNPNRPDKYVQTPILFAAEEGREEMVKLLLGRKDVKPDVADGYGRTLLFWASSNGCEEVVKVLLEHSEVKIDRLDQYSQTPLLLAAEEGHEGVVELLLARRNINPNTASKDGKTPLALASEKGHSGVVGLLLGREDVNPNIPHNFGRTPLSWAAGNGCDGAVRLLLGREDVDPDWPDNRGRTPLLFAAGNGRDRIVKLLLEREGVNPDRPDNYVRTPLSLAAENGHDVAVRLLLRREDVNPDTPDYYCRTPLLMAAWNGRDGVVKLLLEREDVNPDKLDNYGRTPLSLAAENGHAVAVRLLLGREDLNPDTLDNHGRTPLSQAAGNGRDRVLKLLLGREDVNPDRPDNGGRAPLLWAAGNGHGGAVKLLLVREGVNPDTLDNDGRTPLSWAAFNGRDEVVALLLGQENVNPDRPDNFGQTPLSRAASDGWDGVVKLLLARKEVNPDKPDNFGQTPLSRAAFHGCNGVIRLLLARDDINPDMPDNRGRTPLSQAVVNGSVGAAKLLLAREDVSPNRPDNLGQTPLSRAARNQHAGAARLLQAYISAGPLAT